MSALVSMMAFAFIASITPGPVNLIATSSAAGFGYQRTLPHILGATIGFCLVLLLMGAGLSAIIDKYPLFLKLLTVLGVSFLLYTAFKIATAPIGFQGERQGRPPSFLSGVLCQWLNPKAWVVSMSGVAVFVPEGGLALLLFATTFFVSCFLSISVWALVGLVIQRWLENSTVSKCFNCLMGGMLAVLVMLMV